MIIKQHYKVYLLVFLIIFLSTTLFFINLRLKDENKVLRYKITNTYTYLLGANQSDLYLLVEELSKIKEIEEIDRHYADEISYKYFMDMLVYFLVLNDLRIPKDETVKMGYTTRIEGYASVPITLNPMTFTEKEYMSVILETKAKVHNFFRYTSVKGIGETEKAVITQIISEIEGMIVTIEHMRTTCEHIRTAAGANFNILLFRNIISNLKIINDLLAPYYIEPLTGENFKKDLMGNGVSADKGALAKRTLALPSFQLAKTKRGIDYFLFFKKDFPKKGDKVSLHKNFSPKYRDFLLLDEIIFKTPSCGFF